MHKYLSKNTLSPRFCSQDIGKYDSEPNDTDKYATSNHTVGDKGDVHGQFVLDSVGRCIRR